MECHEQTIYYIDNECECLHTIPVFKELISVLESKRTFLMISNMCSHML